MSKYTRPSVKQASSIIYAAIASGVYLLLTIVVADMAIKYTRDTTAGNLSELLIFAILWTCSLGIVYKLLNYVRRLFVERSSR